MATLNKYLNNKFLKTLEPLSKLSVDKLSELANKSSIESVPAGRNLFRQGEKDKLSYYIVSGQIELQTNGEKKTEIIKAKTPEAKYPIAQQLPRPCTAKTKGNCEVLSIDNSLLEMLIESDENPSGAYEVTEINSEDENGWMLKFLQSRAFLQIPTENIQQILMSMKEINAPKGTAIVNQGESNDYYYIVKYGKCSVSRRPSPNAEDVQIAILAAGDGFGEEALIIEGHRNATVRMIDDGVLMRLTKEDFMSLLVTPLLDYIHLDELKSRVSSGDLLVDVRQHKDFMTNHLDGAVNTPLSMIRLKLNTFNTERNVIVYCDDSSRSTAAAFLLIQHGITCSILKDGIGSQGIKKKPTSSANTSMTNIIANLDAVTNREKDSTTASSTKTASTVSPITKTNTKQAKESTYKADKIKEQIKVLNRKNKEAELARQQAEAALEEQKKIELENSSNLIKETEKIKLQEIKRSKLASEEKDRLEKEKQQLELEAQKIRDRAEAEKLEAQQELKRLSDEYNQHKESIEAKDQHHKELMEQKEQAERETQALQEKIQAQKLAAQQELEKQKELINSQLEEQKRIIAESQKQAKLEAERVRSQADKELADLRSELEKTKNSVQERVKGLKEKEIQQANEEIKSRQQHANDAIKESIEKARQQAENDALKVRQQALLEVQNLQKEIELKKQTLEAEADNIRLEAERDRAATLELARQQAKEIVLKTAEESELLNIQRQKLDNEASKIQLQAEAERHATLESAKQEAHEIIKRTAEEAQQLDIQRQRIEEQVSKIRSEAEYEKQKAIKIASQEAKKIRLEAEQKSKLIALKEIERQQSTMELSLKQAEEIRLQAEKEADKIRAAALHSAVETDKKTSPAQDIATHSDVSFANISIPGAIEPNSNMVESEAKSLAQDIVSKLEKAESNRIKEQHASNSGNGLSISSASLKRRSDGKIILEGDEDLFIFKEPRSYSDDELNELHTSIDQKKHTATKATIISNDKANDAEPPEFSFDEPDFDLVDELPNHINGETNKETSISEFSDFELHQPTDIRMNHKADSKRPAQRFVAIAASLFVAVGVGITFLGVNSETNDSDVIASQDNNSFNATRVSGIATNNIEIDKKIMTQAEREFEKLLSKWKKSQAKQAEQKEVVATESTKQIAQ